jgi:hypothetical protein
MPLKVGRETVPFESPIHPAYHPILRKVSVGFAASALFLWWFCLINRYEMNQLDRLDRLVNQRSVSESEVVEILGQPEKLTAQDSAEVINMILSDDALMDSGKFDHKVSRTLVYFLQEDPYFLPALLNINVAIGIDEAGNVCAMRTSWH